MPPNEKGLRIIYYIVQCTIVIHFTHQNSHRQMYFLIENICHSKKVWFLISILVRLIPSAYPWKSRRTMPSFLWVMNNL